MRIESHDHLLARAPGAHTLLSVVQDAAAMVSVSADGRHARASA